jgi:hypothetical protein
MVPEKAPSTVPSAETAQLVELVVSRQLLNTFPEPMSSETIERIRREIDALPRKCEWTPIEDAKIMELHTLIGPNWSRMSGAFENRTACQIKNRWHSVLKKREAHQIRDEGVMRENARMRYPSFSAGRRVIPIEEADTEATK